nr:DUF6602 domain-containing protein [Halalkalicoccus jeotgali]
MATIDPELKSFEVFDFRRGDDELDIVGTFTQSQPRVIFETGARSKLQWVPYEGVAFVCEVKSKLTKPALKGDLEKLRKVRKLDSTINDRFGTTITGEFTIDDPLKCIVYDDCSISEQALKRSLQGNVTNWHLIWVVESDLLIVNESLPIFHQLMEWSSFPHLAPNATTVDNGIFWFLIILSTSIPTPLSISTIDSIMPLLSDTKISSSPTTSIEE